MVICDVHDRPSKTDSMLCCNCCCCTDFLFVITVCYRYVLHTMSVDLLPNFFRVESEFIRFDILCLL